MRASTFPSATVFTTVVEAAPHLLKEMSAAGWRDAIGPAAVVRFQRTNPAATSQRRVMAPYNVPGPSSTPANSLDIEHHGIAVFFAVGQAGKDQGVRDRSHVTLYDASYNVLDRKAASETVARALSPAWPVPQHTGQALSPDTGRSSIDPFVIPVVRTLVSALVLVLPREQAPGLSPPTTGINRWITLSGDKACPVCCDWPAGESARATCKPIRQEHPQESAGSARPQP